MQGEYKTRSRHAMIRFMKENAEKRFTAGDLVKAMNNDENKVNRSTVYRNLERLCKEGKLVKYKEAGTNATCYQYSETHGQCHKHIHAQCSVCGKIYHLDNAVFEEAAKRMKNDYNITIDYGKSVLICLCDGCKNKEQ
ncbi:MAG: transcriptional repressor [Lachnospiraceae bacterium]|nr:transcriptional repressor [Lachnospiraceae bacterium]